LYILLWVDRLCEEKANCSISFSAVVVGVGTTCIWSLNLSYLVSYIFCVVIIADIAFIDYFLCYSYITLII